MNNQRYATTFFDDNIMKSCYTISVFRYVGCKNIQIGTISEVGLKLLQKIIGKENSTIRKFEEMQCNKKPREIHSKSALLSDDVDELDGCIATFSLRFLNNLICFYFFIASMLLSFHVQTTLGSFCSYILWS